MILGFLDIGSGELLLIIVIAIIVFGPSRIPEVIRKVAKGYNEVKKASNQIKREINDEMEKIDHRKDKDVKSHVFKDKED